VEPLPPKEKKNREKLLIRKVEKGKENQKLLLSAQAA